VTTSVIVFLTAVAFLIVTRRPGQPDTDAPPVPAADEPRTNGADTSR
jgi:hypothetical protein